MRIRRIALALSLLWPAPLLAEPVPAVVDVCFVPAETCSDRIVRIIDAAQSEIRVEAYGFSARPILRALARAKARGVDVAVLLDRSDLHGRRVGFSTMVAAGVPVWIDQVPGIAHVKAIIVDRQPGDRWLL
jgi:phosphatidylserine/phosphatidylglycerophosphate/cardiolipin synthase-like enzyme